MSDKASYSNGPKTTAAARVSWREIGKVYTERATLRMLFLGFSAGLPLLLVFGTLSFWLREAGVDRTTIGYLSWVGLAYGFKWVWAPLVDRMPIPLMTRLLRINWGLIGVRLSWHYLKLLQSQYLILNLLAWDCQQRRCGQTAPFGSSSLA